MSKIISNYNLLPQEKDVTDQQKFKTIDNIIKTPKIENDEVKIETKEPPPPEPTEPTLKLMRNQEGVVIAIELKCTCGEQMLIKMDYK